jgi:2-polyprenyl-3-methyl-5-hydroxy-6-metoxy-1,4-benzoquinol methylase
LLGPDKSLKILDLGCGSGLMVYSLREAGYVHVEGIDTDSHQVAIAKSHGLACEQVSADFEDPFYTMHKGAFDVIMMYDLLEHIPKDRQISFLRAVRGCLSSRGRLILRVPNALGPTALFGRYVDHTHHCAFTVESLDFVLLNAGFSAAQVLPYTELRLTNAWKNPWRLFRLGLIWTTRSIWRAAYIGEFGRPALKFPMTRDLLVSATLASTIAS